MAEREFHLSKESLVYLSMLASRVGIDLQDYKEDAIYNRLVRRLRILKLTDFDSYCQRLRIDIEEEIKFINLITNLTTFFFRENHHFEYLAHSILPEILEKKNKIRIWSAACSTGEEPYSIAIVVYETIPNLENYDIQILATDVNTDALIRAKNGIYDISAIKDLSLLRKNTWFQNVGEKNSKVVQISKKLKKIITFNELNLAHTWFFRNFFDIIFCRNVLIYFKNEIKRNVLHRFDLSLNKGGYLILGYSESLNDIKQNYISLGKTIYQKTHS